MFLATDVCAALSLTVTRTKQLFAVTRSDGSCQEYESADPLFVSVDHVPFIPVVVTSTRILDRGAFPPAIDQIIFRLEPAGQLSPSCGESRWMLSGVLYIVKLADVVFTTWAGIELSVSVAFMYELYFGPPVSGRAQA
jgi:hypothetical protein